MKIYLMTDLEGVAGVYSWDNKSGSSDDPQFVEERLRRRRWLAEEINATACGFFDGGASDVWAYEGHGDSIDIGVIDPRVRVIKGRDRPVPFLGLDESFAAIGSVGTHSKAETFGGCLYHTGGKDIRGQWLNGISVGETGYQAFLAGYFGVPFVFCAGDAWACKEMEELVPGCVTVPVKVGLSRLSAKTLTPKRSCEVIYQGALEAAQRIDQVEPLKLESPVVLRIEWRTRFYDPENPPEFSRVIDSHTVEIEAENMRELVARGTDPDWRPFWQQYPEFSDYQA